VSDSTPSPPPPPPPPEDEPDRSDASDGDGPSGEAAPYRRPEPTEDDPYVVAWEQRSLNVIVRYLRTVAEGLTPRASTPLLRGNRVRPAMTFALLTALPAAPLAGIIPFTHTLLFGPTFAITVQGDAGQDRIASDVAQAAGLGLGLYAVLLLALAAPYVSLSKSFGAADGAGARALRVMLYRAWLVPFGTGLFPQVVAWAMPMMEAGLGLQVAFALLGVVPLVLLLVAMRAAAVELNGIRPLTSWAVVLVPVTLFFVVQGLALEALAPIIPEPAVPETETAPAPKPEGPTPGPTTA